MTHCSSSLAITIVAQLLPKKGQGSAAYCIFCRNASTRLKTYNMIRIILFPAIVILTLASFARAKQAKKINHGKVARGQDSLSFKKGYSEVNGLTMYYEIYGEGNPLVLIHGGGSTIESSFGRIIPLLARNRQIIAVEMQAHGRTNDRDADLTFEQDADDVARLLKNLKIGKSDFLGFSNGATTTLQIAIRHPEIVNKMVLGSPLAKKSGVPEGFWSFMENATLDNMPPQLKEAYLKVAPDPKGLQIMHDRDARRMVNFRDIPDEHITATKVPTLIIVGDKDIIKPEHALELQRMIAGSELAIIPGVHGEYIGEITTLVNDSRQVYFVAPLIDNFLAK